MGVGRSERAWEGVGIGRGTKEGVEELGKA